MTLSTLVPGNSRMWNMKSVGRRLRKLAKFRRRHAND